MKRLVLVYNPRSAQFGRIEREVLTKLRKLKGWSIAKYEVVATNVDDNAQRLAKVLLDDDLVIAAGGDATATIATNAVMLGKTKQVRLGVLGYGNFNDVARSLGSLTLEEIVQSESTQEVWPLECKVNGKHWRYGMCYFTAGMFAEACAVFDEPRVRKHLQKGHFRLIKSICTLAWWWLKQRKQQFLPKFALVNSSDEEVLCDGVSDYMAVNSRTVAKVMRGGKWGASKTDFLSVTGTMTKFWRLMPFMFKSMLRRLPGTESDYDRLVFAQPTKIMLQAEGEYQQIDDVETLEVRKAARPLHVVSKK